MTTSETRIIADGGLLIWDGRVLELFRTNGKTDSWRVHAATVQSWELKERKGVVHLRLMCSRIQARTVEVPSSEEAQLRVVLGEIDAVQ